VTATTTNRTSETLTRLKDGITELTSSDQWLAYLNAARTFHDYSFSNTLLIAWQMPTATRVAGFHTWRKLGRAVCKGEKAIWILAPVTRRRDDDNGDKNAPRVAVSFRAVPVFDLSQTDGEPLPEPCQRLTGDDPAGAFQRLQHVAMQLGWSVRVTDDLPVDVNGDCTHAHKCIRVRLSNAPAQQAKTLAHELGHAILHEHYDDRALAECEAESVAYIVTADLGLDSSEYSFGYIASWAGSADDARTAIALSGNAIQMAANTILSALNATDDNVEAVA
jgi:antirestriction protein ArdC